MTYTEFIEAFEKQLSRELEHADIQRFSVQKVNGKKDVLVIRESGADQTPVIYMDKEYDLYKQGHSVEDLACQTASNYENFLRDTKLDENIASQLTREAAHKNLYCAVINGAANRELLKTVPHE